MRVVENAATHGGDIGKKLKDTNWAVFVDTVGNSFLPEAFQDTALGIDDGIVAGKCRHRRP
ncbi:hypothetical protein A5653_17655 [Mycobacterium colombiense]|nr:hypothetical protein A5653_17655 [Mycobacterium colombiense]